MPKPTTPLTPAIAEAHERLYPRVGALLAQVEKLAARSPAQPLPPATLAVAQSLFRAARKILGREAGRIAGSAMGDLGALSVGLGQLKAALETFEAANSQWSASARCTVWRLDGPAMPVGRLKPAGVEAGPARKDNPEQQRLQGKILKLLAARFAAGYDTGYRHASEGLPPSSEDAERIWDALVKQFGGEEKARRGELRRLYGTDRPPPHLMPVGAKPGEWKRIEAERQAAEQAERRAASRPP